MQGVSPVSGAGLQSARIAAEYDARVAVTAKEALELQGDLAVQLIQSANIDPAVGATLNVRV